MAKSDMTRSVAEAREALKALENLPDILEIPEVQAAWDYHAALKREIAAVEAELTRLRTAGSSISDAAQALVESGGTEIQAVVVSSGGADMLHRKRRILQEAAEAAERKAKTEQSKSANREALKLKPAYAIVMRHLVFAAKLAAALQIVEREFRREVDRLGYHASVLLPCPLFSSDWWDLDDPASGITYWLQDIKEHHPDAL